MKLYTFIYIIPSVFLAIRLYSENTIYKSLNVLDLCTEGTERVDNCTDK